MYDYPKTKEEHLATSSDMLDQGLLSSAILVIAILVIKSLDYIKLHLIKFVRCCHTLRKKIR